MLLIQFYISYYQNPLLILVQGPKINETKIRK
jgi:hypothetical protein